ncbi:hypothetical protein V2S66_10735 [Streptomyces sp. V4-01]|uniref:Uncharacterized protein n=1 Tax=Actinacidiphila polyblastidii TaxID=3110430 RepID=A0ABU7P9F0_9ACTN|nr:hypothetical protein [Streptomyces sp. V4-01]
MAGACVAGFGGTPRASVQWAVEIWATTSGAAVRELLDPGGRFATPLRPRRGRRLPRPARRPGRHHRLGRVPDHDAVHQWTADHGVLPVIAPALAGRASRGTG